MKREEMGLLCSPEGQPGNLFGRALEKLALLFAAAMSAVVLVQSIDVQRTGGALWRVLLLLAVVAVGVWALGRLRWRGRTLAVVALCVCTVLRLGYLLTVRTPPISDFSILYDAAQRLLAGDVSWVEGDYYRWWSYQIPFVAYQTLVLKLFPSIMALKLCNLLFMVGIDYLLYRIGKLFLSERAAGLAALLYAVYPASIHMVAVLTNQHISAFFLLLGLWLLLSRRGLGWMALAGACLGVGNLMRPDGLVLLASLVCCGLYLLVRWPGLEALKRLAAGFAVLLAVFWAVQAGTGAVLKAAGIAPYGIKNNRPEWKFILGLDASNPGGAYSLEHLDILYEEDPVLRKEAAKAVIADSFRDCEDVPGFFLGKSESMWGRDESFEWSTFHLDRAAVLVPGLTVERCLRWLEAAERAIYLFVWLMLPGALALLWLRRDGRKNGAAFFCVVTLCAFYCVYLLIEVQPRYRYLAMPFLFLLAGLPMEYLSVRGEKKL